MNEVSEVFHALFPWPGTLFYPLYFYAGHVWSLWMTRKRANKGGHDGCADS